jgi:hypothetical protein
MASVKDRKRKIMDWLNVVNDENILTNIENLMKTSNSEYYNRYVMLNEQNTMDDIVMEGEADLAAKRYISHEEVKKLFAKK